jgi:glycosyltransferase involved in cell wall biosynthesis
MNLNLLFDGHTFDMEPQGTSTFLAGLINALPTIAARHFPGLVLNIHCAAANEEKVSTYLKVPYTYHSINTGFINRNGFGLPRLSRRIQADVVISQYVRPLWVHKYSAAVIHDILFVDFPNQFSFGFRITGTILFGLSARFSDIVFTISKYSKARITEIYNLEQKRIDILPCAVMSLTGETLQRSDRLSSSARVHLLYVSRLEQRKRHEWCLHVFEELLSEGRDVQLTLIGGGGGHYANSLRKLFEQKTAQHGSRFIHLEGVSQEHLNKTYTDTDLFLYPSLGEGFGIPVIEAAAHGVPCVVTNGSALSELKDFYSGQSFEPNDFAQFLDATRDVLNNFEYYQSKAQQNTDKVINHFTWENAAHRFLESIIATEQ